MTNLSTILIIGEFSDNSPNNDMAPVKNDIRHSTSSIENPKTVKTVKMWCHVCDNSNHDTSECCVVAIVEKSKKPCFEAWQINPPRTILWHCVFLPGQKNAVADALTRLDIEKVPRPIEEISTLLDTTVDPNIKFPMYTAFIYHEQLEIKGLKGKAADKPHYSLIEDYDLFCFKGKK
jgi:hypothetical protein